MRLLQEQQEKKPPALALTLVESKRRVKDGMQHNSQQQKLHIVMIKTRRIIPWNEIAGRGAGFFRLDYAVPSRADNKGLHSWSLKRQPLENINRDPNLKEVGQRKTLKLPQCSRKICH